MVPRDEGTAEAGDSESGSDTEDDYINDLVAVDDELREEAALSEEGAGAGRTVVIGGDVDWSKVRMCSCLVSELTAGQF